MASTYENDLRLEEMATGENSGSWGTKTNTNLELIADAFSYGTETIANADTTITIADGAADAARSLALKINSSEDLTTTRVVTLAPNTTSKVWIIENNTSGGQTLTISAGSGSNITLANGKTKIIATDGIGAGSNVIELTQDIAIADLFVDDDLTVGDDIIMDSDGGILKIGADADLQVTHSGSAGTITNATGDLTLDVAGDISLDAAGDQINFKSGGTPRGYLDMSTGGLILRSLTADADIILQGNDGGSAINALTLDMSAAGAATFNAGVTLTGTLNVDSSTTNGFLSAGSNILNFGTSSNDTVAFYANNTEHMKLKPDGEVIINETGGAEGDLRVESDSNTHVLFVDASTDNVGIHDSAPTSTLTVQGNKAFSWNANGTDNVATVTVGQRSTSNNVNSFAVSGTTHNSYYPSSWVVDSSHDGALNLTTFNLTAYGVKFGGWNSRMTFNTTQGTTVHEALRVRNTEAVFNELSNNTDFRVESDGNSHMLFLDASTNRVGINSSSPSTLFSVNVDGAVGNLGGQDWNADKWLVVSDGAGVSASGFGITHTETYGTLIASIDPFTAWRAIEMQGDEFRYMYTGNNELLTINGNEVVINEGSANTDFRVESDSQSNAFQVDASTGEINTNTYGFNIYNYDDGPNLNISSARDYNSLMMGAATNYGSNNSAENKWSWNWRGRGSGSTQHYNFLYDEIGNQEYFRVQADASQTAVVVNDGSNDIDFRVESNNNANAFLMQASDGRISFSPDNALTTKIIANGSNNTTGISFRTGGAERGNIYVFDTGIQFNTTSDERLKENITDAADVGELLDEIQVRQFDWKVNGEHQRYGVVAQEVQQVMPEVVTTPSEPNQMMSIDYSKMVPMLIKEIQVLRSRITALENA